MRKSMIRAEFRNRGLVAGTEEWRENGITGRTLKESTAWKITHGELGAAEINHSS